MAELKYGAFISYSHRDKPDYDGFPVWMHKRLEAYRVPKKLQQDYAAQGIDVPGRIGRVFRDDEEFGTEPDLASSIQKALTRSQRLIVLCSPNSAKSPYVNEEIRQFKAEHGDTQIYAVILDGKPHTNDPETECFPDALKYAIDERGRLTRNPAPREPIAADLQEFDRETVFFKLLAGLLGVDFGRLRDREAAAERARRRRATALFSGGVALSLLALAGMAGTGIQTRSVFIERADVTASRARLLLDENRDLQALEVSLSALPDKSAIGLLQPWSGTEAVQQTLQTAMLRLMNTSPKKIGFGDIFNNDEGEIVPKDQSTTVGPVYISDYIYSSDKEQITLITNYIGYDMTIWDISTESLVFRAPIDVTNLSEEPIFRSSGDDYSLSNDEKYIAFQRHSGNNDDLEAPPPELMILRTDTGQNSCTLSGQHMDHNNRYYRGQNFEGTGNLFFTPSETRGIDARNPSDCSVIHSFRAKKYRTPVRSNDLFAAGKLAGEYYPDLSDIEPDKRADLLPIQIFEMTETELGGFRSAEDGSIYFIETSVIFETDGSIRRQLAEQVYDYTDRLYPEDRLYPPELEYRATKIDAATGTAAVLSVTKDFSSAERLIEEIISKKIDLPNLDVYVPEISRAISVSDFLDSEYVSNENCFYTKSKKWFACETFYFENKNNSVLHRFPEGFTDISSNELLYNGGGNIYYLATDDKALDRDSNIASFSSDNKYAFAITEDNLVEIIDLSPLNLNDAQLRDKACELITDQPRTSDSRLPC